MKKCNLLVILMGLLVFPLFAQSESERDSLDKRPSLIINGQEADPLSLLLLDKGRIKSLRIFSPGEASGLDKEALKFGAVEVDLHKNAYVFSLKELVDFYHLNDTVINLQVIVAFGFSSDKLYAQHPDLLMISIEEVSSFGMKRSLPNRQPELIIVKRNPLQQHEMVSDIITKLDSINHLFQEEAHKRYPPDAMANMDAFMKLFQYMKEEKNE